MTFTTTWFDLNRDNWTKWLARFKDKPGLRFLEIGCFEGRATVWLLENILTGNFCYIHVIDTFEGNMEHGEDLVKDMEKNFVENVAKKFPSQLFIHKGSSQEILRKIGFKKSGIYFDFIYIDGSHQAPDVLEDTILAWRLLKPGGIMVFDDYKWDKYPDPKLNPKMAIDAFLAIFEGKYELIAKEYQVCVEKM